MSANCAKAIVANQLCCTINFYLICSVRVKLLHKRGDIYETGSDGRPTNVSFEKTV